MTYFNIKQNELESNWNDSLNLWFKYIELKTDKELSGEVPFIGTDGAQYVSTPCVAIQFNYHSIHHRAQMQTIIRQQSLSPDFVDYIGTKYRKLT